MGLLDLSLYKVTNDVSDVDATTQNSGLDAIQAVVNALVDANIDPAAAIALSKLAGYPAAAGKYADGLGNWSIPTGSLVYRKNSTTDVNTTTSLTSLTGGGLTLGAGVMGANGIVHVTMWGDVLNNTGGTVSPVSFNVKLGGTAIFGFGVSLPTQAIRYGWYLDWTFGNLGATNSQQNGGTFNINGLTYNVTSPSSGGTPPMTIDTTAAVTLDLAVQPPVSSANMSVRCYGALAQVFAG